MEKNLYEQAILDAKAVRASAIANAKASLQEAFEPKIQEMLRMKLAEELDEELEMEEAVVRVTDDRDGTYTWKPQPGFMLIYKKESGVGKASGQIFNDEESAKAAFYEKAKGDSFVSVVDARDGELSAYTEPYLAYDPVGMGEEIFGDWAEEGRGMEEGKHVEEGEGYTEMTEAELDAILSELESMEEGESYEEGMHPEEESLNEAEEDDAPEGDEEPEGEEPPMEDDEMEVTIKFSDLKDVLAPFVTGAEEESGEGEEGEGGEAAPEDTLSLDEILAELEEANMEEGKHEEDKNKMEEKKSLSGFGHGSKEAPKTGATNWKTVKQLSEANKTIAVLSEKLQEINLLNAKLLYMNKIFKAKNLDESQKIKVVKSFDKASTVKEVKNVYEILGESLSGRKATPLRESRGFASKPAGVAPKTPIVDSDPTVDRWQQLVFGKK